MEGQEWQQVQVYFNLHKHIFSIRDKKTRLVIGYASDLILHNCTFKVSEAGRQRVLREKCKNVHAWIEAEIASEVLERSPTETGDRIRYNPYDRPDFHFIDGRTAPNGCSLVATVVDKRPVLRIAGV
jgi:hypothetical protein